MRLALPIDEVLPDVINGLRQAGSVVLQAPTGAGKTTRVPPAIVESGMVADRQVLVLEPRRLAAQTAARRMAAEAGESIGQRFGYHIRFDRRASKATRVLVVTEGVFLRLLLEDPLLEQVGVVVFDEFHERNLNSDLALAIVRRLRTELRPDLKLAVMSATLDARPVADYLQCPIVTSEGRTYPVEIRYLSLPSSHPLPKAAATGVVRVAESNGGDVLVFLPGVGEIRRTHQELTRLELDRQFAVHELYGDLPMERQEAALCKSEKRKVILATNVAETSVTIEGVTAVVDSGLARVARFDNAVGLNRLEVERISRASADQRAGRAGRTAPGLCLRLWTEQEQRFLRDRETPEILRLDLAGPMLTVLSWGETDLEHFPWLDAPRPHAWEQAATLLKRLGALGERGLTRLGQQLASLPVHPRLGRLLLEGFSAGCAERAATAAALLSERDPFLRERGQAAQQTSPSDLLDRVQALEQFERAGELDFVVGRLSRHAAKHVLRVRDQLLRTAVEAGVGSVSKSSRDDAFLRTLVVAFPDRVARRRQSNSRRAVMIGGRGVQLAETSAVHLAELFVCVEVEEKGGADALVHQASFVERQWLPEAGIRSGIEVEFDSQRERVIVVRRTRYEDLLLEESHAEPDDPDLVSRRLCEAAAEQLGRALPLQDPEVDQFLARVRCLRMWMPQLGLPEFSTDDIRGQLPYLCAGRRSFQELREAPLLDYLRAALTPEQRAALEREAPQRIRTASGRQVRLQYEPGRPPVMPVRIQDMFGQRETPRVAGGRVRVLLHLLGPNMRPQQVTDDLEGFWQRAYPQVRKELRRRYPRHAWPEDPLTSGGERS